MDAYTSIPRRYPPRRTWRKAALVALIGLEAAYSVAGTALASEGGVPRVEPVEAVGKRAAGAESERSPCDTPRPTCRWDDHVWKRVARPEAVEITVRIVSLDEITRVAKAHGEGASRGREGFSILRRDRATGAYRCEIYLTPGAGAIVEQHERLHCAGWAHP